MIECQDVSFSYPASTLPDSERQAGGALKHISCTIEDGSFVLLCGTSGCGKTTMTRLFNGLIPHYHEGTYTGSVYLDGKDTRDLSLFDISLKVGSVFQNPRSQFFNVDTTSELAFGPENHGIGQRLPKSQKTLNMYVNDAIGYRMTPEQVLFYSENCFGTTDAIAFRNNLLRIHDFKSGVVPAHMEQLEIYAALFCLEYAVRPADIEIELRLYQNSEIVYANPTADDILPIMEKIITFDKIINKIRAEEG